MLVNKYMNDTQLILHTSIEILRIPKFTFPTYIRQQQKLFVYSMIACGDTELFAMSCQIDHEDIHAWQAKRQRNYKFIVPEKCYILVWWIANVQEILKIDFLQNFWLNELY